jgi:hypothetical protein
MVGQEFTILPRAPAFVRNVMKKGRVVHDGDGAFSRVYAIDRRTVLKITTCQATRLLFAQLINKPVTGCLKVFKAFGKVAVDEEGYPYYAYVVERLYSQKEWQTLPSVRRIEQKRKHFSRFSEAEGKRQRASTAKAGRGLVKKRWLLKRKSSKTLEAAVKRIQRQAKHYVTEDGRQKGSELIYRIKRKIGLTGAMDMLHRFIAKRDIELDLRVKGNVLLTRDGNICLADPVTVMEDNTLPPATSAPTLDWDLSEDEQALAGLIQLEQLMAGKSKAAPMFRLT